MIRQDMLLPKLALAWALLGAALLIAVPAAHAGGTPENMLLIIDPTNADSLYIGNYYKNARNVPDANVIYMAPGASNYTTFVEKNLPALFGSLANKGLEDHIDYIVVMPGAPFFVYAPGLIHDECYSFSRFSISSVYTMAFIAEEILTSDPILEATESNRYYPFTDNAWGFDSSYAWLLGVPSTWPNARRYFIGAMLGYTGENGNTLEEIIALIDRAVAVDGTHPVGTFYFMNNTADTARNVRHVQYPTGMAALAAIGGPSQQIYGVLPVGHYDCLGIMTGAAGPAIESGDFTVVPGAFCDHLTSYAAQFDTASQTKVTAWINKGACGSWGAVHEPCNYQGKFPHARVHRYYYEGSSMGEAAFRSVEYTPFQMMLYGDPMTRPWAHLPAVEVADAPTEPVSGTITLTPTATTTHPTADIFSFHLHIDGVFMDQIEPDETFTVDTMELADGWHDLRVLAYEGTLVASVGRWVGALIVDNCGYAVTLDVTPTSGDQATPFISDVAAMGGTPVEVRVVQNGRVVAASPGSVATLTAHGLTLGAGPVRVQGEAVYGNGSIVRSAPTVLDVVLDAGSPLGAPPAAYGYTKPVLKGQPFLVELPATFDDGSIPLTYEIIDGPDQATVATGQTGPYRLMWPVEDAAGVDTFTFEVTSSAGASNVATVKVVYDWQTLGDLNCDGAVNFFDIEPFVLAITDPAGYEAAYPDCNIYNADCNGDGAINFFDIDPFVTLITG